MQSSSRRTSDPRSAPATDHSHHPGSRPTSTSPPARRAGQPYPSDPPHRERTMERRSPKRPRPDSPDPPPLPPSSTTSRPHTGQQPLPSIHQLNPDLPPVGTQPASVSPFQRPQQHTPGQIHDFLQGPPGPGTPYGGGPTGGHYFGLSGPSPGSSMAPHERAPLDRMLLQHGPSAAAHASRRTPEQGSLSLSGGPDSDREPDDEGQVASSNAGGHWRGHHEGDVGGALFGPEDPPKKKRRRQALSCTECKRRKIKCDRLHPCGPCTRRGEPSKCVWHIIEPVEKYVNRTELEELHRLNRSLEDRISKMERLLYSLYPESLAPPGLEPPPLGDRRGGPLQAMPPMGMGLAGPGMMGAGPPPSVAPEHRHASFPPVPQSLPPQLGLHERRPSMQNLHMHSPRIGLPHQQQHQHHHQHRGERERSRPRTGDRPGSSGEGVVASSSRYSQHHSRSPPGHPPASQSPTWRPSGRM